MKVEKVFKSQAVIDGWASIDQYRTWWFDTSVTYPKIYSLDNEGIPICWDDETFPVEETRKATVDDTCTVILTNKNKKALIVIHKDLDHVMIQGSVTKEVTWENYNREGLWAAKKHCTGYTLDAVIINPKVKTLEKHKVVKAVIKKVIETANIMKGKDSGSAKKEDRENQGDSLAA